MNNLEERINNLEEKINNLGLEIEKTLNNFSIEEVMEIEGIKVYHSNDLAKIYNCFGACITINNLSYKPYIIVDDIFMKLSDNAKTFVLLHEIGHFVNGDLKNVYNNSRLERIKLLLKNIKESLLVKISLRYPNKETRADFYAASKIGSRSKSINALNEVYDLIFKEIGITDGVTNNTCNFNKSDKNKKKMDKTFRKMKDTYNLRLNQLIDKIDNGPFFLDD